ncbi:C69 family dipeptidase [Lactobacillus delbrueckii]|uniref:C69 family dipeptidase n=1 Tax=Lactobacillus delbrueckii TaxID=1584 RepID=UPI000A2FE8A7|nr:C69 family dipeptidase [Lactobacillus delbrueckii]ARR37517.1 cytosol non-specific dipeptidase-like protein [Lactobacillus delbrueckii subsp. delbrueckii]
MRKFIWAAGALGLAAAFTATPVKACTTVVYGKKATTDGSTLVARNEDVGAWSKHFYVHQATSNGPTTYVSEDNGFKTSLPKTALRYTSTPDGEQVNGHQWIFGENGVSFSNKNEIWYMEIGSGHTWAAVRVPDNKYAVIPNQMVIGKLNLKDSKNYMASTNLVKKVKAWSQNKKIKLAGYVKGTVNYSKAFGTNDKTDAIYNRPRMWDGQRILTSSKKPSITKKSYTES